MLLCVQLIHEILKGFGFIFHIHILHIPDFGGSSFFSVSSAPLIITYNYCSEYEREKQFILARTNILNAEKRLCGSFCFTGLLTLEDSSAGTSPGPPRWGEELRASVGVESETRAASDCGRKQVVEVRLVAREVLDMRSFCEVLLTFELL